MTLENMINKIPIKIKKLSEDAKVPVYGTEHAAGFDIYSVEDYTLKPGETYAVHSGIAMEIPIGKFVALWDRGGMGFKALHRFAGVIDSDFRGEWRIIINNHKSEPYEIKKGDKIVQGILQDYYKAEFEEVNHLEDSERGEDWNNSTGK